MYTVKPVLLWSFITVLNYSFVFEYIYIYILVISSVIQHQSSVSHDPSEIILIGGVLDLKRRCTEWSAYDSREPRELFESFRICLLSYGSRGTVMSYWSFCAAPFQVKHTYSDLVHKKHFWLLLMLKIVVLLVMYWKFKESIIYIYIYIFFL